MLGVTFVVAVFGYNRSFYGCEESQLIKENVEALTLEEDSPQQADISKCVDEDESFCIAMHPTDPSKDKNVPNKKWPEKYK